MSKGKKGSKTTPDATGWDEGLLGAVVQEEDWRPCLVFVCPDSPRDEPHVEALASAVGTRRLFSFVEKTALLQSAAEDAKLVQAATSGGGGGKKSKAAAAAPAQRPMFVEVCEQVVEAMKSGDPLPPSLLAKMIKYRVLKEKAAHRAAIAQKEADEAAKVQASKKGGEGGKGGKGGRAASKAGKKGKDTTPASDADPAIPLPEKPPVTMRKRGEEDSESKYIDDEPVNGPNCYFVMIGFSSLDLFEQLSPVGLAAHVLMNVKGGSTLPGADTDEEEEEEQRRQREQHERDLVQFWGRLGQCVQATRDGHMLRDMARVELRVPQPLVPDENSEDKELYGQSIFDAVCQRVYHVLEQREQYHHYLNYLKLRQLSLPGGEGREPSPINDPSSQSLELSTVGEESLPKVDLRLYNNLLSSVAPESTTIPLILHCMLEQLCSTTTSAAAGEASHTKDTAQDSTSQHGDVLAEINNFISGLCIPTTAKRGLLPSGGRGVSDSVLERGTVTLEHWDKMGLLTRNVPDSKLLSVRSSQTSTNDRACLRRVLATPRSSTEERNAHLAMLHSLQTHCTSAGIPDQLLNHCLLTLSLERVLLPNATSLPGVKSTASPLLFDFPLRIALREIPSSADPASGALVPYSGGDGGSEREGTRCRYQLDLPDPLSSLVEHAVCEPMSADSLLQLLQSLQHHTHPHISAFPHWMSESTVVVAHTGFDGRPLHTYQWQSLAHSRVGFDNYLQHVAEQCGREIDAAVEEDRERREALEEERQALIETRKRELEQRQQSSEQLKEEEEEGVRGSAKGGKKSSASGSKKTPTGKKSKSDAPPATPEPDKPPEVEAGLPEFEERSLYEAYDVGDSVLLTKGTVSVQFLCDGSQIRTEKMEKLGSEEMVTVSALANGHCVSCSLTRGETDNGEGGKPESERDENGEDEMAADEDQRPPTVAVVAGIPRPPPGVKFSSLSASFRDSLRVSLSHFGPRGDGELPFQPEKPAVLLEAVGTDGASSAGSRPQSRQTPQKVSKKQMDQQQQLLEQQRQLEEQRRRERAEAQADYDARRSALLRQHKHQQLSAGTPYGLHVRLQVGIDLDDADGGATGGSDGRVLARQSYPSQPSVPGLPVAASSEDERYYLSDGTVLRFMRDGSISVLCPDGHVYQTATQSLTELYQQQTNKPGGQDSQSEDENRGKEEGSSRPHIQPTFSDTKVTFADETGRERQTKVLQGRRRLADLVWVVTAPSGQRHLWKSPTPGKATTDETRENGESEPAATDEAAAVPGGSPDPEMQKEGGQEEQRATVVPLPSAKLLSATDPVTKQVLTSREDNVTLLESPDGSFVAEHADGTRITTAAVRPCDPSTPPEVTVECPGFARVTHTPTRRCLVQFPDGSTVIGSGDGSYIVERAADYRLEVDPSGVATCLLHQPAESSSAYTFILDHTGSGDLLRAKSKRSRATFSVDRDGVPSVLCGGTIPPHPAFFPRYFVVPSAGSPYQILSRSEVNSYVSEMESRPDATVVRGEPVPGFEGTTIAVMKSLKEENPAIMPYKNGSIIPSNLSLAPAVESRKTLTSGRKRFGVGVGKSLHILPPTHREGEAVPRQTPRILQCRQFVVLDQFNETLRGEVCDCLASYLSSREEQGRTEDRLLPVDPRELSEVRASRDLQAEWLAKMAGDILSLALQDALQSTGPTPACGGEREKEEEVNDSTRVLDGIRRGLEEAERHREALRNHTVPKYFDSDQGREFLCSQSPDMAALASQLAQPRSRILTRPHDSSDPSHSSTPSSLQSASIVLRPGGVDSPDLDAVSVSSVSKIRPAHPTPDHARGFGTPTDLRPKNPTPFGADRAVNSPALSIISQSDPLRAVSEKTGAGLSDAEAAVAAERSVSFILPPRRPSLVVGESSDDDHKQDYQQDYQQDHKQDYHQDHKQDYQQDRQDHQQDKRGTKPTNTSNMCGRKVRTSTTRPGGVVGGLEAQPHTLDFGTVREGCCYALSLLLKNVGSDPCRFRVKQPPPSTGVRVTYTPGPVAAGMTRKCEVELFAIAVGVVGRSGTGHICHDLQVVSETNTLCIPVRAAVLTASEQQETSLAPAVGVRQVQRPSSSSREDYTRPSRATTETSSSS